MTINIDLEVLIKEDLTPDHYVFLWGLYHNYNLNDVEFYPNHVPLEEKGFIKLGEDWMLRTRGKLLFEPRGLDAKFIEFYHSYPYKVSNGKGGIRALRDNSTDTKAALDCKKKYLAVLEKKPNLHEVILKAMGVYVKNESPYLQRIEVFLNQQSWNKYIGVEEDNEDNISEDNKTML